MTLSFDIEVSQVFDTTGMLTLISRVQNADELAQWQTSDAIVTALFEWLKRAPRFYTNALPEGATITRIVRHTMTDYTNSDVYRTVVFFAVTS